MADHHRSACNHNGDPAGTYHDDPHGSHNCADTAQYTADYATHHTAYYTTHYAAYHAAYYTTHYAAYYATYHATYYATYYGSDHHISHKASGKHIRAGNDSFGYFHHPEPRRSAGGNA